MSNGIKLYIVIIALVIGTVFNLNVDKASARSAVVFKDIPSSFWAKEEIDYLYSKDVIKGYDVDDAKMFYPGRNVTRAQAAKMILIAIGEPELNKKTATFKDVPKDHWAYGWIEHANSLGIITGYDEDGTFKPDDFLTRAQMSKIISKAFGLDVEAAEAKPIVFDDIKQDYWASHYINTLYYNGISNGSGNSFKPTETISRAHFSVFISRALNEKFRFDPKEVVVEQPKPVEPPKPVESPKPVDPPKPVEPPKPVDPPKPVEPVPTEPVAGDIIAYGTVTAGSLNVRSESNATSAILGSITLGSQVSVYSLEGNWAKISYNNQPAYVHKGYLKLKNVSGNPLKDRIIVVDAGHGGSDVGSLNGTTYEKNIVIAVAKKVQEKLESQGAKVIMTREGDTYPSLSDRVELAKKSYAELFVSIHNNSSDDPSAHGTETYYDTSENDNGTESKELAVEIQDKLIELAGTRDRGVKDNKFYVIRNLDIPSVLVELAFISNPADFSKLTSAGYQEIFAEAIYQGIKNYYSN